MNIPNLAGVVTADLVEHIGTGKFSAAYVNWSRTVNLLREHAPGWLPEIVPSADGDLLHAAPVGAYLLIRFRNGDTVTPPVPQAVMDTRNAAIPRDKITARDITDTHRRGVCMAAAFTFGLAYELWAKLPLESGYQEAPKHKPTDGAVVDEKRVSLLTDVADAINQHFEDGDVVGAYEEALGVTDPEEKTYVWSLLPSNVRSAIKKHAASLKETE